MLNTDARNEFATLATNMLPSEMVEAGAAIFERWEASEKRDPRALARAMYLAMEDARVLDKPASPGAK